MSCSSSKSVSSPLDSAPSTPRISMAFSNPILEEINFRDETLPVGEGLQSGADCSSTAGGNTLESWKKHTEERANRRKKVRTYVYLALVGVLVLILVALGMRLMTQHSLLHVQREHISTKEEQLNLQKELLEMHWTRFNESTLFNETQLREEQLQLQRLVLEAHKRSNETLTQLLNETTVELGECLKQRAHLQEEMWEMDRQNAHLARTADIMNSSVVDATHAFESQQMLIEMFRAANVSHEKTVAEMRSRTMELKSDLEAGKMELDSLRDKIEVLNDTNRALESQLDYQQRVLEEKNSLVTEYEAQLKVLRLVNESKSTHEERAAALEERLEGMRKQMQLQEQTLEAERNANKNVLKAYDLTHQSLQKNFNDEKERREEMAAQLKKLKGEECYRLHCRKD